MTARGDLAAMRSVFRLQGHELQGHDRSEEPDSPAQQVGDGGLRGSETLKIAQWRDGEWPTEKSKPFVEHSVAWFSVEVRHG